MNLHALPPLIAAIAYLLVAFFVYSNNKANPVNKIFAIMLLCVSLWNVEWAGIIAGPNPEFVHFWEKFFRIPLSSFPRPSCILPFFLPIRQESPGGAGKPFSFFTVYPVFIVAISWTRDFHGDVIAYPWGYSFKWALYTFFISYNLSSLSLLPFSICFKGMLAPTAIIGKG